MDVKPAARPVFGSPERDADVIDAEAEAFFRQPSYAPLELIVNRDFDDDDTLPPPLELESRRAMHATLGILGVSVLALGSFLIYSKVLMPTPVELGSAAIVVAPDLLPSAATPAFAAEPVMHASPVHMQAEAAPAPVAAAIVAAPVPAAVVAAAEPRVQAPVPTSSHKAASKPHASAPAVAATPEDALVKQAFHSLNAGRAETAIAQARRALDSTPNRADAWLVLGSAYDALHDHHSAQLAFRACTARANGPFLNECKKLARD